MTGIVPTPAAPVVPAYPALGSANFNQEAYAYGSSMPAISYRIWEIGKAAEANATYIAQLVQSAGQSEANALEYRDQTYGYKQEAAQSEANALAYAQATGTSAGIPTPVANSLFQSNAVGGVFWGPMPKDASKLDKVGGVATALGQPSKDHGVIPAGGIVVVDVSVASIHKIQAAGSIEIQFTGWAGAGVSQEVELHCVNFGGKTQKWAPGLWVKSDRTRVPEVGLAGINWLTSGQNDVLVRHDFGANVYVAM
jgi:hypothetical protein